MDRYDKAGSVVAVFSALIILYCLMTMDFSHPDVATVEHAVFFDGSSSLLIPADENMYLEALEAIDDSTFVDLVSCDTFRLRHHSTVQVSYDGVNDFLQNTENWWKSDTIH